MTTDWRVDCPMNYQAKTTVVHIFSGWWDGRRFDIGLDSIMDGQRRVAIMVGQLAQMDIMSISHSPELPESLCAMTVVYLNNGKSLEDIVQAVKPYEDAQRGNWLILDVYAEFGKVEIFMCMAGQKQEGL